MADPATGFAPILTSRQRRHPVELPEDPTEEELARDWALSAEDRIGVGRALAPPPSEPDRRYLRIRLSS